MRNIFFPRLVCTFAAHPQSMLRVSAWSFSSSGRDRGALQSLEPELPNGDPLVDPPRMPHESFPTDVPVPEPIDVPAWEPVDDPPPTPQDPQPRPVP